ncbi:MAG: hypothetical protein H6612_13705 [Ignavibacteriales bacterium]|nr:hypothetical protein [Ignavibacteriales bacterium]
MLKLFSILTLVLSFQIIAQNKTLQLSENQNSPNASLEDVKWIAGHWRGTAFGGITDEIWSPPLGESMMFMFKLVDAETDTVVFYESGGIVEHNNSLILRFKHFTSEYIGWEEKDESLTFRLVKVDSNNVYFEGFTFERINEKEINIYVNIEEKNGSFSEVKFNYKRFR